MRWNGISASVTMALLYSLMLAATGCQTTVGGQTLPSPYYLKDDVQYYPAGPEFKLSNQVQALEEYKLEREKLRAGVDDEARQ
jgi:hypothetical protein